MSGDNNLVIETKLYGPEDRFEFDRAIIDAFAVPLGDNYGDDVFTDYLYDYSGYARKFEVRRVFEIGVRYAASAIAMCLGAQAAGIDCPYYLGIDDESYHYKSCEKANEHLLQAVPFADAQAWKWNSITQELPPNIGLFDLVSVDGNHSRAPVLNDLRKVWPIVKVGGVVVLDDATIGCEVHQAIEDFLFDFGAEGKDIEYQYNCNLRNHVLLRKVVV